MNTCQLRAQHMFSWSRYCDWLLIMISHEPRALKETRWGFTRLHWACFINTWIIKSHCQVHLRPNSLSASPLIHRFLPHLLWSLILLPFFIFKAPVCHTHLCMNIFFFFASSRDENEVVINAFGRFTDGQTIWKRDMFWQMLNCFRQQFFCINMLIFLKMVYRKSSNEQY